MLSRLLGKFRFGVFGLKGSVVGAAAVDFM